MVPDDRTCFFVRTNFKIFILFLELALFTKYLKEEREALHHDETVANRKLNTHQDVTKAYSQQHMPTIPQFYEHV